MDAKELRIGNYVYYNGCHSIITTIGKKSVIIELGTVIKEHSAYTESQNPNLDEIAGILLTEEWLLDFDYINTIENYWSNGILEIRYDNDNKHFYYEYLISSGRSEILVLQYVHQFQNLYFALTGKELTLKEN
ncbi:hypothetical protein FY557_17565 [Chryseobacterium sp. SN22]|uniref:hypothetical protein n=1 Tax=Chryseobacterium sp. SN22 TaxID=2606431 RepID=UPI0011EC303E|nr:hypothetical protein [Chryseobacterium sp. SN22]KAA0126458.1 hypothetical protein FY557_17565 [Chryseobacterium sp. SN22]